MSSGSTFSPPSCHQENNLGKNLQQPRQGNARSTKGEKRLNFKETLGPDQHVPV